jgi:hypothetical protein
MARAQRMPSPSGAQSWRRDLGVSVIDVVVGWAVADQTMVVTLRLVRIRQGRGLRRSRSQPTSSSAARRTPRRCA